MRDLGAYLLRHLEHSLLGAALLLFALKGFAAGFQVPNADTLYLALGDESRTEVPAARLLTLNLNGQSQSARLSAEQQTPMGSLWKLFIYDYLVTHQIPEHSYQCKGQDKEEVYCCSVGQSVERDEALIKSCGLYFLPHRFGITAQMWTHYQQANKLPAEFASLEVLRPESQISVVSLLEALRRLPSQKQIRQVLLDRLLLETPSSPGSIAPVSYLGSRLRIKSWSWHLPQQPDERIGGFAGWLTDGTPVWAGGKGTSQRVLQQFAPVLAQQLPATRSNDPEPCVEVTLFERYPVQAVTELSGKQIESETVLDGRYNVSFVKGNHIAIESQRDISLRKAEQGEQSRWRLVAHLSREEYVARVLDREAGPEPLEAAKALAVAARTYLLQNARKQGECLKINDSSQFQRVSPRPSTPAAQAIAQWSRDLVLAGADVTYHQTESQINQLSWEQAKTEAEQGWRFDRILSAAFPAANLSRWDNLKRQCQPLSAAQTWLERQIPRWRPRLNQEPGYQETTQFVVCRLTAGNPYVDRQRRQIYIRRLLNEQDRLDLTHEYLHLAFEAYPLGQDENYIETLTRRLLLESWP